MTEEGFSGKMAEMESMYQPQTVTINRDEIFMSPKLEDEVNKLIHTFGNGENFGTELGYRGALLTGASGVGKTLLAHYIATKTEADIIPVKSLPRAEFVSGVFEYARAQGEANKKLQILVFDEFHKYSNREDLADPKQAEVIDQLKIEMDGGVVSQYVKWICMSDKPEGIDNALRRNKRLGKHLDILPPNQDGRYEILRIIAYKLSEKELGDDREGRLGHNMVFKDPDLKKISKDYTHGYSGDDLWGLLTESATTASYNKKTEVSFNNLLEASKIIIPTALKDMPFIIPKKSFKDMGNIEDHIGLVKQAIGEKFNESTPKVSILTYGPSGSGKSTFAEALAKEYGANLLKVRGSALMNWLLGKTGHEWEKTVARAKIAAPSVLLLDEFNSFAKTKEMHGYKDTWTGKIRSMMDEPMPGVVVMANLVNPYLLEEETLRRFNLHLQFSLPSTAEEYTKIWDIYLPDLGNGTRDKAIASLSKLSDGLSGYDIEQICNRVEKYNLLRNAEVYHQIVDMQQTFAPESKDKQYVFNHVEEFNALKELPRRKK